MSSEWQLIALMVSVALNGVLGVLALLHTRQLRGSIPQESIQQIVDSVPTKTFEHQVSQLREDARKTQTQLDDVLAFVLGTGVSTIQGLQTPPTPVATVQSGEDDDERS